METRILLSPEGPEVSRLALGTWRLMQQLGSDVSSKQIGDRLVHAINLGITTLDTAEIYGLYEVEERLGHAFAATPGLRDRMEIVTKCGIYVPNERHPERKTAYYNSEASRLVKSVDKSLRLLQTDRIDLLLVHRPDWMTIHDETAKGLEQLLASGKVLHVGVSNYNVHQFEALQSFLSKPLVTNQMEFSLIHSDPIFNGTLDQLQRLRRHPMAWSPLAGGRLLDSESEVGARFSWVLTESEHFLSDQDESPRADQWALSWLLHHGSKPCVVLGTMRPERLESAAKALQLEMSREQWYALLEAVRGQKIP